MFSVYGLQGHVYTGPLDRVRDLAAVQAVARLRALAPVAKQEQPWPGAVIAGRDEEAGGAGHAGLSAEGLPREALAAYAQSAAEPRQPLTLVQHLMSREVVSVPVDASLRGAWARLAQAGVGQAPVLDGGGRLVGLITRAELLSPRVLPTDLADAAAWAERLERPVAESMWTPVPGAQPETGLREAAQLLLDLHLPGLPVLDDQGALQGFLSRGDLLRALTHEPPLDLWS